MNNDLPPSIIVPVVTHIPNMFATISDRSRLKYLIERRVATISGIDFFYTPDSTAYPKKVKISEVRPVIEFYKTADQQLGNFFQNWILSLKDPDIQEVILSNLRDSRPDIISEVSMDILFIRFDESMLPENIIDAFILTGMWPTHIDEMENLHSKVYFTGKVQHTRKIKIIGKNVAKRLALHVYTDISDIDVSENNYND